jgi:hypothetical protein
MKGNRAVLTAVVILVVALAGWWLFRRGSSERIDLLALYDQATKTPPDGYAVGDITLAGDTKRAISAPANGRLTWNVRIPEDGWLKVSLGLKPEAWDKEGNGVWFYVGVSDGHAFEELFNQHVDPYGNKSDRRWVPVFVDLSAYAGEDVNVVFNTRTSAEHTPDDPRNDMALWGAPAIVIR